MSLVPLRVLLDHAATQDYGHPAFNITNLEQIHAVFLAAKKLDAPVVIQYSRSARKYATDTFIKEMLVAIEKEYKGIPFAVHQDHGNSIQTCLSAIQVGFSSVMIDGSLESDGKTPASFEYNVAISREMTKLAHGLGVSVEGELGVLGSLETGKGDKEDGHGADGILSKEQLLTDPVQAAEFVKLTKVDSLAVAIGTSHGAYKFSRKPTGDILDIQRIAAIAKATGSTHLVMHGSSSVPQEIQNIINQYGGEIPQTYGVPIEEIQKGIKSGVRKVNIDTDLRMAFTAGIRKTLFLNKAEFDPRKYLGEGLKTMQAVCEERYHQFGCVGKASLVKVQNMQEIIKLYS